MRYFPKEKAALAVIVSSLILSALMFLMATKTITNVSGVMPEGVLVFKDSNCASECKSIEWGTLTPGSAKKYDVYVLNKDVVPIYLNMSTTNWSPSNASYYLTLRWNYAGQKIDLGDVLQLTLTLSVSPIIKGVSSFSFDIVITGSDRLPGDVDGDGDVDGSDMRKVVLAMFTVPGYPDWNPNADVNGDGRVDGGDKRICQNNMFESWQPNNSMHVDDISIPVNKLSLLAPYIGLTVLLAVAVTTVVYVKKRKRNTEISS